MDNIITDQRTDKRPEETVGTEECGCCRAPKVKGERCRACGSH